MSLQIKKKNSQILRVKGFGTVLDNVLIADAYVTVTLKDVSGNVVGAIEELPLTPTETTGTYSMEVPATFDPPEDTYVLHVDGEKDGHYFHREYDCEVVVAKGENNV